MTLKQYILLAQMESTTTSFFQLLLVSCMLGIIMTLFIWDFRY